MRSTGYQERTYRNIIGSNNLVSFNVIAQETDLLVHATKLLEKVALDMVLKHRWVIENYISTYPDFLKTLVPWSIEGFAPKIIRDMVYAGEKAGVGPMAAVAGAVAQNVGNDLLLYSDEVVAENGGDVFIKTNNALTVGIYAADSPLSLKIGLRIDSRDKPVAVCTSSGTVGHSLSFGKADAVCIVSDSCSLADAAATSIGNRVKRKKDIKAAIEFGNAIEGVTGIVIIIGDAVGFWGDIEVISL
ncbi:MAG: UPF0280 family protein [Desulfobacterium sp.]|nr:UPF0280 family protein [Desulfobacterium sp.]MBU3947211.1 UPF0280 family protein [Pseudomonadota bacterium]MBU4011250.1 UPF0280 family protein [Pseudomonadota bacterium]MBU4036431.1 UPF0280 family protein [Pseudomonadota bacterium]